MAIEETILNAIKEFQENGKQIPENLLRAITADYVAKDEFLDITIKEKAESDKKNEELYERAVKSEELVAKLDELTVTDGLTKLKNHVSFMDALEEQISLVEREKNYSHLSVVMMDMDYFKDFNDTYGHIQGDQILVMASRLIKHSLRAGDIAARYGGEEFGLILPYSDETSAREITQRVLDNVAGAVIPFKIEEGKRQRATFSAGIITYEKKFIGVLELLASDPYYKDKSKTQILVDRADKALYLAKKYGRNRLEIGDYMMQNGNNSS